MSSIFNPSEGTLILNGHTFKKLADGDDVISFPDALEIASVRRGMDGAIFAALTMMRGEEMGITLMPDSPSIGWLWRQYQNIITGGELEGGGGGDGAAEGGASGLEGYAWNGSWQHRRSGWEVQIKGAVLTTIPGGWTMGAGNVGNLRFAWQVEELIPSMPETEDSAA